MSTLSEAAASWASRVAVAIGEPARLAVAFSGGVDSTVLLALAVRQLGVGRVLAVLAVSPSLAQSERESAGRSAASLGVPVIELLTHEVDDPAYRANGPDRCFHCKSALFAQIEAEVRSQYGVDAVAYGENADDARRLDRPGAQAATDHHVLRPLAAAGLTKTMVRELARQLGLAVADKPAAPCLASRIPHFTPVTAEKLAQIERAEAAVRSLGFSDVRVRHHGEVARVEVPQAELSLALAPGVRDRLVSAVRRAGFAYVALDLAGLTSGAFTLAALRHD
ncbi:MAG: ATP-dependent sacrificial sulfur transferase LarE [Propionibacteriaceae bacterium]|jgi:uncharacterized protein|nr:ATP-dependent sacrificial sulfur transferase LarE [Propionibacteriaceae bacterium]